MTAGPEPRVAALGRNVRLGRHAWLRFTHLVAGMTALLAVTLVAVNLPYRFNQLNTFCTAALCGGGRLLPTDAPTLQRLGLSLEAYAIYTVGLNLLFALFCWAVAAVLMWRKSDEHIVVLAAVTLLALGASGGFSQDTVRPEWYVLYGLLFAAAFVAQVYLFYLFPDGHFVPRWTRWAIVPPVAWFLVGMGLALLRVRQPPVYFPILALLVIAFFGLGGLAQIYRFWRVSSSTQRQQSKWVVVGIALFVVFQVGWLIYFGMIRPALGQPALSGVLFQALNSLLYVASLGLIPLSLGIAILRYRLWDIDLLIRRTLVYGVLTGLLALAYISSVVVLQAVIGAVTGQQQPALVTVLSTLVGAAVFASLRRRVQTIIDRRFYRRKYDAARTLDAFSADLRHVVELDQLTNDLLAVVDETMQPDSVSLWLRATSDRPPALSRLRVVSAPGSARRAIVWQ